MSDYGKQSEFEQPYGYPQMQGDQPYGYPQAQGYQPYGYPQAQGYQPYGQAPAPRGTNVLAILALVLAFFFAPAGIVCGVIARRQIRETGEEGAGLATAGMWVGIAFTAFFVLMIVLYIVFFVVMFGVMASSTPT